MIQAFNPRPHASPHRVAAPLHPLDFKVRRVL